ncbi:MAG: hypothetical protein E6H05_01205 [Bacillati bacterium ANGP1]|uniref:SPOR domain-containing protein n=1 Tax=Candidatus Segetimicrobium genomatis TaxID=2569760 RepID=A0A537J0R8_9BACT|nr:MAG: hypothetical protein E6H05_01205 [Terrabacteria group bacterium ANGP1]
MRPTICPSPGGRGMNGEWSESHVLAEVLSRVRRRVLKTELGGVTVNERPKTVSGKKFSITIQVPDDVAAQWPDRSTAERLIEEIFRAMSGASSARPSPPRARTPVVVLFLAALFAAGLIAGYLGARAYTVFSSPVDRPATAAALRADPASTPQATTPQAGPQPAADLSVSSTPAEEPQPAPATVSPEVAARTIVAPAVVYHVQIGAFRLRENADTLIQLLDRDGFKANVLQSGKLYIVYIGTFADQKDAARLANQLRNHHYDVVVIQGQAQAAKN